MVCMIFLHTRCKIDKWKGTDSFALIAPFVWQILGKNMTYLALDLILTHLDLSPNLKVYPLRSSCIYFKPSQREKHDGVKIMSFSFVVEKLLLKMFSRNMWPFQFDDDCSKNGGHQRMFDQKFYLSMEWAIECFFPILFSYHSFWNNNDGFHNDC